MKTFIGIDLGTSAVKLLLVDQNGKILNTSSAEYPLEFPAPGWSQQNPEDWMQGIERAMQLLLQGFDSGQIHGIGVGGQMHGLVALDAYGQVIRPAILWNDGRTAAQTEYLNRIVGKKQLTEQTGNIAFAGFTAPKLLWMQEHEPQKFAAIAKILLPKDYIVYRLTGICSTDPSDASGTLLFDVKHRCWSKEMLKICGIQESQMPQVRESTEVVGMVRPEVASRFGLGLNVPVCAGAGDNAAAAVGCGVVGDGQCNISLGTSGTIFITSSKYTVDPCNALHSFAHADGAWHQMGCILSAASCNKWWMDIVNEKDYAGEQAGISRLGENNVYYLPYLMGERSPHNDILARACFIGMAMDTKRCDMTQAVLEGVAFAIRDCLEAARAQGIRITSSKICGGGAKSELWRRILACVLNIPLQILKTEQGPAYGAAILAAVAAGTYRNIFDCCKDWVSVSATVYPQQELAEKYNRQYIHWKKLYPLLQPFFHDD